MSSSTGTRALLFLFRHRAAALGFAAILAAFALFQSRNVPINDDYLVMLPREDPIVADFMAYNDAFKQLERMVFDVSLEAETDDPAALPEMADALYEGLVATESFDRLTYQLAQTNQTELVGFLLGAMPALMNEEDRAAMEGLLDAKSIRDHLSAMRRELTGPNGVFLKHVVPYDPIGIAPQILRRLEVLRPSIGGAKIVDGRIASADGSHLMIVGEPNFPSSDYGESKILLAEIDVIVEQIAAEHPESAPRVFVIGGHRAALDNVTIIERDIRRTISIAVVTMILLSLVAYRRRWLAFATMLPAAFGTLMAGLVLSMTHEAIYSISIGFGIVLLGITVDYAIHVIFHLENHAGATRQETAELLAQIAVPIGMGAVTTTGAFALMMLSPVAGHRQAGLFAVVGLASAAIFSVVILPLLIPQGAGNGQSASPLPLTRAFDRLSQWRARHGILLLAAGIIFTITCAFGISRLRFEGDLARINGVSPETKLAEVVFRETWGDALSLATVMVTGATEEEALRQNDRLAGILADFEAQGDAASVSSISQILPSEQTQLRNMKGWSEFWNAERREEVRSVVASEAAALGYRASAFDPFFDLIGTGGSTFSMDRLSAGPLGTVLEQRFAQTDGRFAIGTLLQLEGEGSYDRLRAQLEESLPNAALIQGRALTDHISDLARSGLRLFAVFATLAVLIVLFCALGSIELVAVTLAPIAISIVWTFGVMGYAGLPVDLFNSVFIIFIIGVGIDYSIFLVTARLAPLRGQVERFAVSGGSITICALTTMISCGVLMLARHPALFSIGITALLGMFFSFVSALVFVPVGTSILLANSRTSGAPRFWHLLGGMWIFAYGLFSQLLLFCIVRPVLHFIYRREPERIAPQMRAFGRAGLRTMFSKFPYGSVTYGNITAETFEKPAITISNHQSSVDIPLIGSLPGDIRMTLKPRVANAPWLGVAARNLGHVVIHPGDPALTLEACRSAMAEGASVHFFPEGTRSLDTFCTKFHKGAFELAAELGCDILPIVLCDTGAKVPRDGYWVEYSTSSAYALDRITPENFDYSLGGRELMRHAERLMRDGFQERLDKTNTIANVRRKVARRYRYLRPWSGLRVAISLRRDPLYPQLDSLVPRTAEILEIGCGIGLRGNWLTEYCDARHYTGVDEREESIRIARASLLGKRHAAFERHDILDWDWPQADVIILAERFAGGGVDLQRRYLEKARQALSEDGIILIPACDEGWIRRAPFDPQSVLELCGEAGLVEVEIVNEPTSETPLVIRARIATDEA